MKRNLLASLAVVCCIVFTMAIIADLNGKWTGVLKTPDGNDLAVTYNFKTDGDKLTGTAESNAGIVTVDNGRVVADSFYFKVTVDGNDYPHKGKVYNDSCSLDVDFGGEMVHTVITRSVTK